LELKSRGHRPVLVIGGHHQAAQLEYAANAGLDALPAVAVRVPRNKLLYPIFAIRLALATLRTRSTVKKENAAAALCMGSFASVPLGLAMVSLRRPLHLHEGNAVAGRANRLLSRWARTLMLSFPLHPPTPTKAEQLVVGMPVRDIIRDAAANPYETAKKAEKLEKLGLYPDTPTLLVFGGSQGAQAITDLVRQAAQSRDAEANSRFQIIHLTGNAELIVELTIQYEEAGLAACVMERSDRIDELFRVADFIICRAGSSTITELVLLRKAALYIPLPTAMDDHQTGNARNVTEVDGGEILNQRSATATDVSRAIDFWLENPDVISKRGENLATLAKPNAAQDAADRILASTGAAE
jgi:UDP-N-acetylglucosamine--N-acetylmuramyl-(pentapeptide) pyrophosphoryl-undecaprenol N-acetylglucosamine transferase